MANKVAKVVWKGDMTFEGLGSTWPGGIIPLDAEEAVGGHDRGFRPLELLLVALAGCTAMDVISILRKKQQAVTAFEVEVEGIQVEEHPRYFGTINVVYRVTGYNVDEKAVARAIELSETKYCGASAMLREKARITSRYEILEAEQV
ncbi:MAG: OsmC family protein [Anaerolineae bacterium]|nr:OsmC family protein [Anaerolineae bacterium]